MITRVQKNGNRKWVYFVVAGFMSGFHENLALMVSPLVPATYLAIGLTGTELKDHMKFSIPPYYLVSLLMLVFGVILGIVTI